MKKVLSMMIALLLALVVTGCGGVGQDLPQSGAVVTDGATIGEGSRTFAAQVVDLEGNTVSFTVKTDKDIVGEALQELGVLQGEEGPYGLTVITVDGEAAVWDTDNAYWAIWIGEEMATTGVSEIPVYDGSSFRLEYTPLG